MRMFRKLLLTFGFLLLAQVTVVAQGTMKGNITDAKTGEPLPFANVIAKQDGKQILVGVSDFDGVYTIKPLPVGKYDLEVRSVGYATQERKGINVSATGFTVVNVELNPTATMLEAVEIVEEKVPVIEIGKAESGQTLSSDDIARMPGTSVESVVAAVGGIGFSDGGTGTARGESGMVTMQGNVRKHTSVSPPKEAVAEIQVILGGTPASIGEAIGGTQIITLKPPTSQFKGMVRWDSYLDYRLSNSLSLYLTGPVYKKNFVNDDGSSLERTLIGFRLTGQGGFYRTPYYRPRGYRYQMVNDELVQQFEQNPLRYDPLTGAVDYAAEYQLHGSDFHEFTRLSTKDFYGEDASSRMPNLRYYGVSMEGALDFRFSDYSTLTLTAEFSASHQPSAGVSPLTMNLQGANIYESIYGSLTADFVQRFRDPEVSNEDEAKAASPIKNVMYNITGMVSRGVSKQYNENYGKSINDIFKYGYIGKFETEKVRHHSLGRVDYNGTEQLAYVQDSWMDSVTYVSGSEWNPILSNYNNQLFFSSEFADVRPYLTTIDYIRGYKGLFNGDSPSSILGLLTNVGVQGGSYGKSQSDALYLQAKASADIKGHEIEIGFQYDQTWSSSYSVSAYSIWNLMRQDANRHITEMDIENPIYERHGSQLYVNYNRKYAEGQQQPFDACFRSYIGAGELEWIDIDRYSPDDFVKAGGINMFSAKELINSGNPYVSYLGYSHNGDKFNYNGSNWSLEKFFNPGESNFMDLPSFSPIYMAGYIQDKFYFQDLIFNVGVRVDYFDGHQYVLKDPYLLYESYTVGSLRSMIEENKEVATNSIYAGAGDDWIPYVDAVPEGNNSTFIPTIKGYRDMNGTWYDALGREVASPNSVNGMSGKPTPYRTPAGQKTMNDATVHTNNVFERYKPQIVPMPRIAFSFPVGDRSQFKASYDIIARRPSSSWNAGYLSYLYMSQINSVSNPNLKPERITNYELGFQQAISQSSAVSASAYYKETRDLIQLIQYAGADPNPNYYSYDNKDFRTIKGVTLAYDMRQTKNIRISANYTLQYAEETGLSSNTMTSLIKEGYTTLKMLNPIGDDRRHEFKANVDFRYFSGAKYNGPTITRVVTDKETGEKRKKEIKLLEDFGVNFIAVAQSGRPYTRAFSNSQYTVVGSYRGARLPWGFYFNVVFDKTWPIQVGKRTTHLTAYLTVNNVFNIRNVLNVYAVTGNPEDDGYLTDPETQAVINSTLNPVAYREIYPIVQRNGTWNYSTPRMLSVSLSYNF